MRPGRGAAVWARPGAPAWGRALPSVRWESRPPKTPSAGKQALAPPLGPAATLGWRSELGAGLGRRRGRREDRPLGPGLQQPRPPPAYVGEEVGSLLRHFLSSVFQRGKSWESLFPPPPQGLGRGPGTSCARAVTHHSTLPQSAAFLVVRVRAGLAGSGSGKEHEGRKPCCYPGVFASPAQK